MQDSFTEYRAHTEQSTYVEMHLIHRYSLRTRVLVVYYCNLFKLHISFLPYRCPPGFQQKTEPTRAVGR